MAATIWSAYNTKVRFGLAGTVLNVTNMAIRAVPYAPEGDTTIELFDGRRILTQITYGYELELSWGNIGTEYDNLRTVVNDLFSNDGLDVYPVYDHQTGTFDATRKLDQMIPSLGGDTIAAIFNQRARNRSATLKLYTKDQDDAQPLSWITE